MTLDLDEQRRERRERAAARRSTPEGKAKEREWAKKWRQSENGKRKLREYRQSAAGKAVFAAASKRYLEKPENKTKRAEYLARPEVKERQREHHRRYYHEKNGKRRKLEAMWRRAGMPEPTRPVPNNCECCGKAATNFKNALHLDHCHETGAFRGWLCTSCNVGIGALGDNSAGLQRAQDYLARPAAAGAPG